MKILKKINLNTILLIAIVILAILFLRQCGNTTNLKDKLKISNMNQIALTDSLTTSETKNGTLVTEKSILIASKKELKDLNIDLYNEVKDLKKKPKIIFKEKIVIEHDTEYVHTNIIKYADGSIGLKWDKDTTYSEGNFQELAGETKFKVDTTGNPFDVTTALTTNKIGMSFTTGLTEGDDTYKIFITSKYPGFSVSSIEGAIIDKDMITSDESSVVIGPSIGPGMVFNGNGVHFGVFIGATLTWNLNKPIKKIFRPFGL